MIYGIVTHVNAGIGVLYSGGKTFKFPLSDNPKIETGMDVMFEVAGEPGWASHVTFLSINPTSGLLQRIESIEKQMIELKKAYELPEDFFAEFMDDEESA